MDAEKLPTPLSGSENPSLKSQRDLDTTSQKSGTLIETNSFKKLRRNTTLAISGQLQMFYVAHLVARDVIGPAQGGKLQEFNHLSDTQFEWTEAALYFPYATLAVPLAFLFLRVSPRVFIGVEMFCWGLCIVLLGLCTNYAGLICDRAVMGACMSFALPALLHMIYEHHGRYEAHFVVGCVWGGSWFMVPLFTMLAIAIRLINAGKPGWSWDFFIAGLCSVVFAPVVWYMLPENFYSPKWISKYGEQAFNVFKTLTEEDYGGGNPIEPTETPLEGLISAAKDPLVWFISILGFFTYSCLVSCYAQVQSATFEELEYTAALGQLIIWTILVFGVIWSSFQGYLVAQKKVLSPFLLMNYLFCIIGWALILCKPSEHNWWIKFGGGWFTIPNATAAFASLCGWLGSNVQGRNKRLMSFAIFSSVSCWYGVLVLRVFTSTDGPLFKRGCWINMGFMIASVFGTLGIVFFLKRRRISGTNHATISETQKEFVYML
ncbi:major facilitator superfamily domain-containing protein [Yarrowia lipolytica]|jgi:hypothetical protein|uniref:YALI0C04323p n=2 Tax=Yarrowia lipolytica TaxID=4952 RepID=Q6CD26_YARLI|nr:YALI0C04323p [Yarrowia lipolytica CLIB122]AOW02327.1 hypothetical protein YALI1_C05789g [Yarrowia lipolytica]KAB8283199.1 major facilitator superfamily domain-containing protein [Yarrowia lipolytica]KAE8173882.1 major facilitator superfamily domain-containing protein [Yarrowia lipolytica]KAJ8053051.1 major facilitator superfamily domain-containing protein [Yarrowia lipolytica]RDW24834.1 major facilitator superfamily domain-containing protein [Yarrowia lipolytica]|eukprot:XP_501436.1 YALI0C04323p [Yarrowia lipolytica CLIB122]